MKRVLIDSAALRVSMPGFDADTATLDQMAFDARFASIHRPQRGTVNINARNFLPDGPGTATVFFSPAFATIPFVEFSQSNTFTAQQPSGITHYITAYVQGMVTAVVSSFPFQRIYAQVYVDRIEFQNWNLIGSNAVFVVRWIAIGG